MIPISKIENFEKYFSIAYYSIGGSSYTYVVYYREEKHSNTSVVM